MIAIDTDQSGSLDRDEIRAYIEERDLVVAAPEVYLKHWDEDGNGVLNGVEIQNAFESKNAEVPTPATGKRTETRVPLPENLVRLDLDLDGRLSPRELASFLSRDQRAAIRRLFETYDKDLSGHLETNELSWLGL